MQRYIIIHYGEIYLKGGNRKFFEDKLIANIRLALKDLGSLNLKLVAGRIIILIHENWDLDFIKDSLQKVFGIEYFAFAWNSEQEFEKIKKKSLQLVKNKKFKTFRITARRTNKNYQLNSQEIEVKLGDLIREKLNKKVDLEKYDLDLHVDIVRDYAFIYFNKIEARGGLPVGSSGKLICLMSGGIDSPVAANLMQKRGSQIAYVHFDAYPSTPKENQEKVKDLVKILNNYQFNSKLYLVPFLKIQKEIIKKAPEDYRIIFYRRMMLRIVRQIAFKEDVLAFVTGESLGQVASQTVENIRAISESVDLPILRPLIGMNKEEITELAKLAGTYDLSIQPFDDCCSLYVPKHPVTHADLNLILDTEKNWQFDKLLDNAISESKIIELTNNHQP
ncbi:MAG: tRNA 4-thiouridine(8) synthase ThiI [Candidatus Buchananbacteria bacterium]|nr:tRNA 4-thiouridine(8) synthase ThiI [Candidatus Buchananbacteria bacterium]